MKKKITFLLLIIFAAASVYSQNYTISFDASGITNTLDSVRIINLTHPDTAMWHSGDVFQLQLNNAINDLEANKENLLIFPNPMQGKAEIMFNVKQAGIASINIYEITGKEIIHLDENLSQGNHQFQLTGLKQGAYFINIRGNGYFYSSKLISYNSFSNDINLRYNGVIQEAMINKYKTINSSINFNFVSGDILQYTGYAANLTAVVTNSPTSDITIIFNFIASIPGVTTDAVISITTNSSICGGNVTSDGGEVVTARGICYATATNPTIANTIVTGGSGTGLFTTNLTGLTPNTTYYVRAYATNSVGTAYGNEISFTTTTIPITTVTDYDGNIYDTIHIGTQIWMKQNLKTIHYNNGTPIPNISDNANWAVLTTGAYCYNNNTLSNSATYGKLYNWYSVNTGNLCPLNWHVPSDAEWTILENYLGGDTIAGGKLKEAGLAHWVSPNTGATNSSGFTALPGGFRFYDGSYGSIGSFGNWWSSTEFTNSTIPSRFIRFDLSNIGSSAYDKTCGFSVRCLKDMLPTINTASATFITDTTSVSGGNIISDGGILVIARGVCWNTLGSPTTADSKTDIGMGIGSFVSNITGLTPNTTYYVRAYATNILGTAYGNEVSFITTSPTLPSLTTTVSSFTSTTATSGGNISSNSGTPIIARGICWNTLGSPITTDSKIDIGLGIGSFVSNITGLTPNTTYYLRAFATNGVGTFYGNEINFTTTPATLPILTTSVSSITATTAISVGNISSNGGAPVIARGICWSTAANPDITLNTKMTEGTGSGSFTSNITGLIPSTTYYVRAYATNAIGTVYGNEISFATTTIVLPSIITTNTSLIASTTATSGGNISYNGGDTIIARGVCWDTLPNPSIALNTKTANGTGDGIFVSNITGLAPNTTYYVRAYATNSIGTVYGDEYSFNTTSTPSAIVTDYDGNVYDTVQIGSQIWMKQNLKTTHYNNGVAIVFPGSNITDWQNNTTGAYAWYDNDSVSNKSTYGALYNWYAVNTGNLCPIGWHVPSDEEWTILENYLGGYNIAGGKIKSTGTIQTGNGIWNAPNFEATNETGFSALPGGCYSNNSYSGINIQGYWWCSTDESSFTAFNRSVCYNANYINKLNPQKNYGYSVRCLRYSDIQASVPIINTTTALSTTDTTAISGGNIMSNGGVAIVNSGICWSTTPNPTVNLSTKTSNGSGISFGTFSSIIYNLIPNATYYVRAYATNSLGTAYGNELSFTTKIIPSTTVFDYDGNGYDTIQIGTQVWLKQNLKTTHYKDGTAIVYPGTNNTIWQNNNTGAYTWFTNNEAIYKNTYGALYNWHAVNTGNLCPLGWHVPSDAEWETLANYLGGNIFASGKLKSVGTIQNGNGLWNSPNIGANNSSGFTALPGSNCHPNFLSYTNIGFDGYWWSSTYNGSQSGSSYAIMRNISSLNSYIVRSTGDVKSGFSVRCLRDSATQAILPIIKTITAISTTDTTAVSSGIIVSDGGNSINFRGVCWSTINNPTVQLTTKTIEGSGIGSFTSIIAGLSPNTTYYLRAYATNSVGTAYGNEISFTTTSAPLSVVVDYDGNIYDTVQIGTQIWMKQNLNTTHYKNGAPIPNITNSYIWSTLTTGAYCDIDNYPMYSTTYGRLYNWFTVSSDSLCPNGWHVPNIDEWAILKNYLGGASIAGGKLKAIGTLQQGDGLWNSPNSAATNSTGFTAIPAGKRQFSYFTDVFYYAYFWSSTNSDYLHAISYGLSCNYASFSDAIGYKDSGLSVRCVKD